MLINITKDDILAPNDMIESGAYFDESIKWYNDMFLSPFVSRMAYFVFFVVYGMAVYFAISFGIALFPLRETRKMVIKTMRDADTYISKVRLREFDTPAKSVLSVLIKNYVVQREQYVLDDDKAFDILKRKNDFMRRYSSQRVFADFKEEIGASGSRADRLMNSNIETRVSITGFSFVVEDETVFQHIINKFIPTAPPKSAMVTFVVNGQAKVATLSYIFSLPDSNAKGRDKEIMLNVVDYSVMRAG